MKKIKLMVLAAILVVAVSGMVMGSQIDSADVSVNVSVQSYAEVVTTDNTIDVSVLDSDDDNNSYSTSVTVNTNHSVTLGISSSSFSYEALNEGITYSFNGSTFSPGEGITEALSVDLGTESNSFGVAVVDDAEFTDLTGWEEVPTTTTDGYGSTVTFTISG